MANKLAGAEPESELDYRIRSRSQLITEQGELINELRDQLRACLANPSDPKKYDLIMELLNMVIDVSKNNTQLIHELQADIEELRKSRHQTNQL